MLSKIEKILSKKYIALSVIAVIALIVYSNSFRVPFFLDDSGSIANNYSIRNPLDIGAMWEFYSSRIITYITFSLNFFIHQTEVTGYHIVNLIIHIFNGFLVLLILRYILGLKYFCDKVFFKYRNIICVMAVLIFICHPVQVNAVTYTVQRIASLATMFYLLAVLFYLKYRLFDKIRFFILTMFFIILAMLTKENTITIPFMLILIEFMFFLNDGKTSWKKRIFMLIIICLTLPIIPSIYKYLGGHSQSDPNVTFKASTNMDQFHYFYTQMNVIVNYIRDLFVPDKLNFDYSNDYPISKTIFENSSYISFAFLLFIGFVGILNVKKNKLIAFGIFWFFIGLAVESSFISIKDVYFEHRLYFPIIGFIIFLIGFIFNFSRFKRRYYFFKKPMAFFIVSFSFMIIMFSCVTLYRNYIFGDEVRLWTDVVIKAPLSDRAHCCLATGYLNKYDERDISTTRFLDDALNEFNKTLELRPGNQNARCNLSKVYLLKKEYQKCINEANNVYSSQYASYNAGKAYTELNKTEMAIKSYMEGLKVDNKCVFILKALGNLYKDIGDFKNSKYYYEEFLKYNVFDDSKDIRKTLGEVNKLISEQPKLILH